MSPLTGYYSRMLRPACVRMKGFDRPTASFSCLTGPKIERSCAGLYSVKGSRQSITELPFFRTK